MQPLRTKGWDKALVEYTAAMLTDTASESKPPLAKRLRDIKCPGNISIVFPLTIKLC
jgi:hypothetical protein